MSIQGVAVIIAPGEMVWHGDEFVEPVTSEDGSEDVARQKLMVTFAETVLGPIFGRIDPDDAWHVWQIAEKKGYQIKRFNDLPIDLPVA